MTARLSGARRGLLRGGIIEAASVGGLITLALNGTVCRLTLLLRLCRNTFRRDTLQRRGLRIQSGLNRDQEAALSLFVAVRFVVVLWVACHVESLGCTA